MKINLLLYTVCSVQVTSCFWNSDQSLLATCSQDKVVQLWSISQSSVELQTTFSCITRLCLLFSGHRPSAVNNCFYYLCYQRTRISHCLVLLVTPVRWTDQAVRGPVHVITCRLYTGAQEETSWRPLRSNTSIS